MSEISTLSPEAFEARYHGGRDPWSLAASAYELNRYRTIMASLRMAAYGTIYEPGCSIGVLTQQLAAIATRVIAIDIAPSAIDQAKLRCADQHNVQLICADLRTFVPEVPLDLIVFSEVGYYFSPEELSRAASRLADCLLPAGEFVAAHWLGSSADHVLHGNRVHEILHNCLPLSPLQSEVHSGFRLDSWTRL
jgi:trans-aconitate methyltransferase